MVLRVRNVLKDYIIYGVIAVVMTGCGSAWLERLVWDQEVAGSNPVTPILIYARVAQWWSIALPRRGSRVRIPSRALFI